MLVLRACLIVTLINIRAWEAQAEEECGRKCLMTKDTYICTDVPNCIPDGIANVEINNTSHDRVILTATNFTGRNWDKVIYLRLVDIKVTDTKRWIISETSFVSLESVRELYINIKEITIHPNALVGLSTVKVIDFSGCYALDVKELSMALNGTNKLVGLNKIKLSDWNRYYASYNFDDELVDVLLPRNITDLDVSQSSINLLNLTTILKRMEHLTSFNLSNTVVADIYADGLRLSDVEHLKVWDVSRITLPNALSIPLVTYYFNNYTKYFSDRFGLWQMFFSIHTINITGIFKELGSLWIKDCQLIGTTKYHFHIKDLEMKENNLNRLDIRILGVTFDIEYLGLSNNNLEFLHSSLLSCSPNLTNLDLSRNRLYVMSEENPQHFGQLFSGVPVISYVNLSHNNLTHIPRGFIKDCHNLSTIDLSYNRLTQFTLTLSGLTKLRSIDLRNNNIRTLDARSLQTLNIFTSFGNEDVGIREVVLTSNPISCSVCAAKPFLSWLQSTPLLDINAQELNCIDEKGNRIAIDETVISAVHYICIRKTIIISVTVSTTITFIFAIAVFVWLYKRRTYKNILAHRHAVIDQIRNAEGPYEFPVFLSYSSKDDDFAQNNILPHVNDTLRQITGIYHDRNFVCTGDANLRPGFYVHDEIDICLDRCSVVIILVTEHYCASNYCGSELEKAYMKKRPVILMFKEHVSEDVMSRTMRDIYKRNVRILWAEQNGEYVLQTTWENVCTSIIDLID